MVLDDDLDVCSSSTIAILIFAIELDGDLDAISGASHLHLEIL